MEQASAQTGAQIRVPAPRDAAPEENDQVDLRRRLVSASSTSELRRRLVDEG